ncbi:MAG: SDR family oxidoreductase [Alphaproteobacteria bacterium]|nr:SDR family oxidoreductase [Alphaproteobacteria bacterium]
MRLFIHGLGYTAERLALQLAAEGWGIAGSTRDPAKAERFAGRGWNHFGRAEATHLLLSAPPQEAGDPFLPGFEAPPELLWAGYLSTTGVYGDRVGGWVDERSALLPTGRRGRRRVEAEAVWAARGLPLHLFRIAGIYGPGRNALQAVRTGRARRIIKQDQVFSRIHVDDIVTVLVASIMCPNPGRAYNLADDRPAPPAEVTEFACRLLGLPPPPAEPFETAVLPPMAASFYRDSKRVSNARIKAELGVRLRYPSYREGLQALYEAGEGRQA